MIHDGGIMNRAAGPLAIPRQLVPHTSPACPVRPARPVRRQEPPLAPPRQPAQCGIRTVIAVALSHCAGSRTVQAGRGQPRRRLCGFTRVGLGPGETATARIGVPLGRLRLWDVAAGRMAMPPRPVEIGAGASSADIRQVATLPLVPAPPGRRPARVAAADFDD
jgi:hypothetical protein